MLYIFNLQVNQTITETLVYENQTSGSVNHINTSEQTKLVDAATQDEAIQKLKTYYQNLNTESETYSIQIKNITDTIV